MKKMIIRVLVVAIILLLAGSVTAVACIGKITGGGFIPSILCDKSGKANYGFVVMHNDIGPIKGSLEFQDNKLNLHSTEITGFNVLSKTDAVFAGYARVNNVDGYRFWAHVSDNGEPGVDDYFEIEIWNPSGNLIYDNGNIRDGGNIQIHY